MNVCLSAADCGAEHPQAWCHRKYSHSLRSSPCIIVHRIPPKNERLHITKCLLSSCTGAKSLDLMNMKYQLLHNISVFKRKNQTIWLWVCADVLGVIQDQNSVPAAGSSLLMWGETDLYYLVLLCFLLAVRSQMKLADVRLQGFTRCSPK